MTVTPGRVVFHSTAMPGGEAASPFFYSGPNRPGQKGYDADQREVAERIGARHPGWLVIWAPDRRCFTAIAACLPDALIIDERDPLALITLMDMAQLGAASSAVRSRVWPPAQQSPLPYPETSTRS